MRKPTLLIPLVFLAACTGYAFEPCECVETCGATATASNPTATTATPVTFPFRPPPPPDSIFHHKRP